MAGGYVPYDPSELGELRSGLREIQDRLAELEAPTGSQTAEALSQIRALVNNLAAEVAALAASGVTWAGPVTTSGEGDFAAGLRSTGAAALDLSTISGSRQPAWQHIASGRYGYAPSTLAEKRNVRPVPFTAAEVLAVAPRVFWYRGQLDIRDNPDNPAYNPEHQVPDEIGLIAEELIAAGLEIFVVVDDDGTPRGVHYELFGAVAALVVGADHEARIAALEAQGS